MRHFDDAAVRDALSWPQAIAAVREVLAAGLDPEAEPARASYPFGAGELLVMPASGPAGVTGGAGRLAGVKLAAVAPGNPSRGLPRIQASYVLFDADTLAPLATLDGAALTALRTPAVSALAVDLLAPPHAHRLVIFGSGPQAEGHVAALRAVRPISQVRVVARDPDRLAAFVARLRADGLIAEGVLAESGALDGTAGWDGFAGPAAVAEAVAGAELIACCTTARTPLFDGRLLGPNAVVVACGSHEPDAREVDTETVRRCGVAVEAVGAATREAGDVLLALADGAVAMDELVPLADLVRGATPARPRLVKTVGMGWQDLAVAGAVFRLSAERA